jgi:hypothetical protein
LNAQVAGASAASASLGALKPRNPFIRAKEEQLASKSDDYVQSLSALYGEGSGMSFSKRVQESTRTYRTAQRRLRQQQQQQTMIKQQDKADPHDEQQSVASFASSGARPIVSESSNSYGMEASEGIAITGPTKTRKTINRRGLGSSSSAAGGSRSLQKQEGAGDFEDMFARRATTSHPPSHPSLSTSSRFASTESKGDVVTSPVTLDNATARSAPLVTPINLSAMLQTTSQGTTAALSSSVMEHKDADKEQLAGREKNKNRRSGAAAVPPPEFPGGMNAKQRALFLLARWASGAHFEGNDPMQALALDLFINALQVVNPLHVHQGLVMHVLSALCTSAPQSLVRVYYARALRTLFARGSSAANTVVVKREGDKKPVPNLAKSVIIAIHDIIYHFLHDTELAQLKSRQMELPPLSSASAHLTMLPGLSLSYYQGSSGDKEAGAEGFSFGNGKGDFAPPREKDRDDNRDGRSPNWTSLAPSGRMQRGSNDNLLDMRRQHESFHDDDSPFMRRSGSNAVLAASSSGGMQTPMSLIRGALFSPSISPHPMGHLNAMPSGPTFFNSDQHDSRSLRLLDTSKCDTGFDLRILMGFIGDLLSETRGTPKSGPAAVTAPAAGVSGGRRRTSLSGEEDAASSTAAVKASSGSSCGLSCSSCGGSCSVRLSTLTLVAVGKENQANEIARESAKLQTEHGSESSTPSITAHDAAERDDGKVDPAIGHLELTKQHNIALGRGFEFHHSTAGGASTCDPSSPQSDVCGDSSQACSSSSSAGDAAVAKDKDTATTPGSSQETLLGVRKHLASLCPSTDFGGVALGLWMEASRAVAHAACRLSAIPDGGDGVTQEYKSVLAAAFQLCSACPLLREIVIRRILRRWPAGNSDNEIALLEFLAAVLASTTHRADLVVTDLRGLILSRVLRCLRSPHIKVARNALILVDPSRKLIERLVDDELSLNRLLEILLQNSKAHWSPLVRRASGNAHAIYALQLQNMSGGRLIKVSAEEAVARAERNVAVRQEAWAALARAGYALGRASAHPPIPIQTAKSAAGELVSPRSMVPMAVIAAANAAADAMGAVVTASPAAESELVCAIVGPSHSDEEVSVVCEPAASPTRSVVMQSDASSMTTTEQSASSLAVSRPLERKTSKLGFAVNALDDLVTDSVDLPRSPSASNESGKGDLSARRGESSRGSGATGHKPADRSMRHAATLITSRTRLTKTAIHDLGHLPSESMQPEENGTSEVSPATSLLAISELSADELYSCSSSDPVAAIDGAEGSAAMPPAAATGACETEVDTTGDADVVETPADDGEDGDIIFVSDGVIAGIPCGENADDGVVAAADERTWKETNDRDFIDVGKEESGELGDQNDEFGEVADSEDDSIDGSNTVLCTADVGALVDFCSSTSADEGQVSQAISSSSPITTTIPDAIRIEPPADDKATGQVSTFAVDSDAVEADKRATVEPPETPVSLEFTVSPASAPLTRESSPVTSLTSADTDPSTTVSPESSVEAVSVSDGPAGTGATPMTDVAKGEPSALHGSPMSLVSTLTFSAPFQDLTGKPCSSEEMASESIPISLTEAIPASPPRNSPTPVSAPTSPASNSSTDSSGSSQLSRTRMPLSPPVSYGPDAAALAASSGVSYGDSQSYAASVAAAMKAASRAGVPAISSPEMVIKPFSVTFSGSASAYATSVAASIAITSSTAGIVAWTNAGVPPTGYSGPPLSVLAPVAFTLQVSSSELTPGSVNSSSSPAINTLSPAISPVSLPPGRPPFMSSIRASIPASLSDEEEVPSVEGKVVLTPRVPVQPGTASPIYATSIAVAAPMGRPHSPFYYTPGNPAALAGLRQSASGNLATIRASTPSSDGSSSAGSSSAFIAGTSPTYSSSFSSSSTTANTPATGLHLAEVPGSRPPLPPMISGQMPSPTDIIAAGEFGAVGVRYIVPGSAAASVGITPEKQLQEERAREQGSANRNSSAASTYAAKIAMMMKAAQRS